MGAFLARVTECPLKRQPICFELQENFTTTGREINIEIVESNTIFDRFLRRFCERLREMRAGRRREVNQESEEYPGWNRLTLANLRNIFIMLTESSGIITFKKFCLFLDSIGDDSAEDYRQQKFTNQDSKGKEYINFPEFLSLIYHYHPPNEEESDDLNGVAKVCLEIANQIDFINSLTVEEQLQYGLF